MDKIFDFDNYRAFLLNIIYSKGVTRGIQARMSAAMGCQAAYFSQVLKGNGELSEEQGFKLSNFLRLTDNQSDYFILLIRLARASTKDFQDYLEKKRKEIIISRSEISNRLNSKKLDMTNEMVQTYFSSWIASTVHIATSSEKYQTIENIAKKLQLPYLEVEKTLLFLVEAGLVNSHNGKYTFSSTSVHIPKSSQNDQIIQLNRRLQVIKSIQAKNPKDIHFNSLFTVDLKTIKIIQDEILHLIEKSHEKIHSSGTDELYAFCIDFFEVV